MSLVDMAQSGKACSPLMLGEASGTNSRSSFLWSQLLALLDTCIAGISSICLHYQLPDRVQVCMRLNPLGLHNNTHSKTKAGRTGYVQSNTGHHSSRYSAR